MLSFGGGDQLTDFERAGAINALKDIECGGKLRLCCVVRVLAADQAWRAALASVFSAVKTDHFCCWETFSRLKVSLFRGHSLD